VKESDRIAALAENLRKMGATVEERPDGLKVAGHSAGKLRGAEIEPRAITASRWRLRLRDSRQKVQPRFAMPNARAFRFRPSTKT